MAEEIGIVINIDGDAQSLEKIKKLQIGLDRLQRELREVNKAERDGLITSSEASRRRAELNLSISATRNALRDANVELLRQNDALRRTTGLTGLFRDGLRNIGTSLATTVLGFAALNKAIGLVKEGINTMKEFEQQMVKVKAITGANDEQFKALKKSAIDLSGAFSSLEIGKLQEEFAKLGFTTDDILAATEATIQLSVATGEDLAGSAQTLAATLNGFGLAATDTQKVVDIMAKSFNDSALGLENFSASMSQVAPVAKVAGASIEETTALIEVLVNAGFDGSKAGTALRNIFTAAAKEGISVSEAFEKIRNAQDPLTEAVKLFGKEAAAQAVTLANNKEQIDKFEESLKNAGGTAAQTAGIVGDTLSNDVDKLSAAWDKFILSIDSGDGIINNVLRELSQDFASLLNSFSEDKVAETFAKLNKITNNTLSVTLNDEEIKKVASSIEFLDKSIKLAGSDIQKLGFEQDALNREINRFYDELAQTKDEDRIKALHVEIALRRGYLNTIDDEISKQKKLQEDKRKAEEQAEKQKQLQIEISKKFEAQINKESIEQLKTRLEEEKDEENKAIIQKALKKKEAAQKELEEIKKDNETILNETKKLNAELLSDDYQRSLASIENERVANIAKINESKAAQKIKIEAIAAINATAENKIKQAEKKKDDEVKAEQKKKFDDDLKTLEEHGQALILQTEKNTNARKQAEIKAIQERRDFELQNTELTADQRVIIERKAAEQIDEINKQSVETRKQQNQELNSQILDLASNLGTTLISIAGQRADREKQIELDNLKAKNEQGLISQQDYEAKRVDIEKKAFEAKKKRDLAFIAIELAKQIISIQTAAAANPSNAVTFGAAGISQATILTALAVANAGIQAAAVSSQQFAEGGYTGDGFGKKDSTGFKQAGVVHEGEYVAPKWVLETKEGASLVNRLENIRNGKVDNTPNFSYANGGFVAQQQAQLNIAEMEYRITNAVINSIGAIPVINSAVDTANVARKVSNVQTQATFG